MPDDSLIDFVSSVSGDEYLKVEETLGDGYVRLRTAEAERRQAKHDIRHVEDIVIEMLRNARDAGATKIFLATGRGESHRSLTFIDNGCGIPEGMKQRIFDARVTSKLETMVMDAWGVHGRGMALYSIKENTSRAFVVDSDIDKGSAFYVDVDLDTLSERTDQSTYPQLIREDDGTKRIARGPHNIIRTVLEFSLDDRDIDVYLGSASEICATMIHIGQGLLSYEDLLFSDDPSSLPLFVRPATCADAQNSSPCRNVSASPSPIGQPTRILADEIKPRRTPDKPCPQDANRRHRMSTCSRILGSRSRRTTSPLRTLIEGAFMHLEPHYFPSRIRPPYAWQGFHPPFARDREDE